MTSRWVWFDFENMPHVLFLEPLIRRLREAGCEVRVTAKPQGHTLELAALRGIEAEPVGDGDFVGLRRKILGGGRRALQLALWALRHGRPHLLVSSSRSASLAAWLLRVQAVGLLDYEHAEQRTLALGAALWFPDLLQTAPLPRQTRRIARFYPGLKENLYLDAWRIDRASERRALGVPEDQYLVVSRPPANEAHYQSDRSGEMWRAAITALAGRPNVRVLVVARTRRQRRAVADRVGCLDGVQLLDRVVNGPGLVVAADLILGGGGTMNREAAVLGVPAWSTFCGPPPRIDEQLAREGRLHWIRCESDLRNALAGPLPSPLPPRGPYPAGIGRILEDVEARLGNGRAAAS